MTKYINGKKFKELREQKTRFGVRELAQRINQRTSWIESLEESESFPVTSRFLQGICMLFRIKSDVLEVQKKDEQEPVKVDEMPKPKPQKEEPKHDKKPDVIEVVELQEEWTLERVCKEFTEPEMVEMLKPHIPTASTRWKEETLAQKILDLNLLED